MRKVLSVLAMSIFSVSMALAADQPAAPVTATATVTAPVAVAPAVPAAMETQTGIVKSISMANAAKGTKSEIVIVDAAGKETSTLIKSTTTLYDADAKAITLDKIAADSKVAVVYIVSPEGVNEASSVKLVK